MSEKISLARIASAILLLLHTTFFLNLRALVSILNVHHSGPDRFAVSKLFAFSILLNLVSSYPTRLCGMCTVVQSEHSMHGFDAIVSDVREHECSALDPCEMVMEMSTGPAPRTRMSQMLSTINSSVSK